MLEDSGPKSYREFYDDFKYSLTRQVTWLMNNRILKKLRKNPFSKPKSLPMEPPKQSLTGFAATSTTNNTTTSTTRANNLPF